MLTAHRLKVEYKTNPIGTDERIPRFSYELTGTANTQSAYKIVVKKEDGELVWDSGFVEDDRCTQIPYLGKPLDTFTRYNWSVQLKDENGKVSPASKEKAFFETGFIDTPWTGKWICRNDGMGNLRDVRRLFRRFEVKKKVAKARLYTTALGLYQAYINGKNVTEDIFTPGWTDYYNRVQYQAYDVTKLIKQGVNVLADLLAEGWFCGMIARNWNGGDVTYGPHPALRQELHLTYADGTTEKIVSDENYRVQTNPACSGERLSDIYLGETFDAQEDPYAWMTAEEPTWDEYSAKVLEGEHARIFYKDVINRSAFPTIEWQSGAPIRRIMALKPVSIKKRKEAATYIVDFGQNLTGRERIKLKKTVRGTVITIRHGEMLNEDGSLYTSNLRKALATTTYIAGNNKNVVYEPTFTWYGFRYLEISGWPGELTADNIEAHVIHSKLEEVGAFECSDPLINKLFQNIVWGQRSNFLDVPTDCPQRDERLGWTGDTQVFANVATYNMNCPEFYTKWIKDLNLCSETIEGFKSWAPDQYRCFTDGFFGSFFSTGWADAGIVCPDVMLRKYGDIRLLEAFYTNMKDYLLAQIRYADNKLIVSNTRYHDWLNLDDPTSDPLLCTAYMAGMMKVVAHHAELLGKKEDATYLSNLAEAVKEAFQKEFFKNNKLVENSQTAALLTLHFDLAPEKAYKNVCKQLVKSIKDTHKLHLSTGFLGTPLLLPVLTKIGEIDLAYDLLSQTSYPGWLYPVTQGATTMWERWNSWNEDSGFGDIHMNSFNHYAYGAVGEWFYETICGIQPMTDKLEYAGFKHFRLAPRFGKKLDHAMGAYHSQYGVIASGWRREENMILWMFEVPIGTTAEIDLPGAEIALGAAGIQKIDGKFIATPGEYQVAIVE